MATVQVREYNRIPNNKRAAQTVGIAGLGSDNELYLIAVNEVTGAIAVEGSFSATPVQYNLNGVPTEVSQDTATPANSRPLPIQYLNTAGVRTDLATLAAQNTGNTTLTSINTALTSGYPGLTNAQLRASAVVVDATGSLVGAAQSGAWTVGASQSGAWSVGITGGVTVSGTVAATQSGAWNVGVSSSVLPTGAATEATLAALNGKVTAVNTGAVVIASSALPAGAATEAKQDTQITALATSNTNTGNTATNTANTASSVATINTKTLQWFYDFGVSTNAQRIAAIPGNVTGIADFGAGTTGAQTPRVTANITRNGTELSYGAGATDANTQRVVNSNESNPKVGRSYVTSVRNDYTSVSVTTGAWVQLVASSASVINQLRIFDSSGQTMELGTGAAAAETRVLIIPPGGFDSAVDLAIPAGTRISIRAVSASASVGELDITMLS